MGLVNWIFKGVKVEKRKAKTRSSDAVMDLTNLSPEALAALPNLGAQDFGGGNAASILFENTERQASPGFQYDANSFGGGQFGASPGGGFGVPSNAFGAPNAFGASALGGSSYGNRNILVVTPSSNAEVTEVVTNLRNGDACIVCLEGLDVTDAQRRLDFLSGVICAMNGSIKRLNANTYILTPTGIGVRRQNQ